MAISTGLAVPSKLNAQVARDIHYQLAPDIKDGQLRSVNVTIRFFGDADGETFLNLPDEFAGQKQLWRHLSNLRVSGAMVEISADNIRILRHRPNGAITINYRISSAYDDIPSAYAKGGAIIRPQWFSAFGEATFATIGGRDHELATFDWSDWPQDWKYISDLDHGQLGRRLTSYDIAESILLASPDMEILSRTISGGMLRVGMFGEQQFSNQEFADAVARTLSAQREFWQDVDGPFTVTLYALKGLTGISSAGGTGRGDAFAMEASGDIPLDFLVKLIAHEHNHTWIPRRLGSFPDGNEAIAYWFSEGVTDFYTPRTLLSGKIWTSADFAADLNEALGRYAVSPVRDLSNMALAAGFWNDAAIQQLPYDRGRLFALLVDYELRKASGDRRNYDDLINIMRGKWNAAAVDAKPEIRSAFTAAAKQLQLDIDPLLGRYIDRGEPINLPDDIFGQCAVVENITRPAFDPGFDRTASTASGVIEGVDPDGPAAKAGLRNGMKRIKFISSGEGNSTVTMAYRIADEQGERDISWLPAGKEMISLQHIKLSAEAETAPCIKLFGGVVK